MLRLIQSTLAEPDLTLPPVLLRVERRQLAKRLWRGVADDGVEFGFELTTPLKPGDMFHQSETARYVIEQEPEPVLTVALADLSASAVAGIGWAVGNLHLELAAEPGRLLTPDEPAARQLFGRIRIEFMETKAVFRPGRFARGAGPAPTSSPHDLGSSHRH